MSKSYISVGGNRYRKTDSGIDLLLSDLRQTIKELIEDDSEVRDLQTQLQKALLEKRGLEHVITERNQEIERYAETVEILRQTIATLISTSKYLIEEAKGKDQCPPGKDHY